MTAIIWRREDGAGWERCVVEPVAEGHRVAGTTLLATDGGPFEIRYSVLTDPAWHPHTVGAHVQGPGSDRRMALTSDGAGSWSVGENPLLDLFGAIDVDLAWTPVGTMVAIRRIGIEPGEDAESSATRVAFPGHEIGRSQLSFKRIDDTTYTVESGDWSGEVVIDTSGVVTRHVGGWELVAAL